MGSKGINFQRTSATSWHIPSDLEQKDKQETPEQLRYNARKIGLTLDSLQERYAEFVQKLEHSENSPSGLSSLAEEIEISLDQLELVVNKMRKSNIPASVVNSNVMKLQDFKKAFQTVKRREEEKIERMELFNSSQQDKESTRLEILMDEKISLSQSHTNADDFIEHGRALKDVLSNQTNNLQSGVTRLRDLAKGTLPSVDSTMKAIKYKKTRNIIILAIFISALIIILILYTTWSKTSSGV